MININLHHIIGIKIQNSTINIKRFINEEFYNFIQKKNFSDNFFINFKKKIIEQKNTE